MFEDIFALDNIEDETDIMPIISVEDEGEAKDDEDLPNQLPILALKNTVLFPGIVIPITVGRDKSIRAITEAYEDNRIVAVLSQRDSDIETPTAKDLYEIGTIARILKLLKMPDGTTTAILQGRRRSCSYPLLQGLP